MEKVEYILAILLYFHIAMLLNYYITVLLCDYMTILLYYYVIIWLYYHTFHLGAHTLGKNHGLGISWVKNETSF